MTTKSQLKLAVDDLITLSLILVSLAMNAKYDVY